MSPVFDPDPTSVAYILASAAVFLTGAGVALYERFGDVSRRFLRLAGVLGVGLGSWGLALMATTMAASHLWLHVSLAGYALTGASLYSLGLALVQVRRQRLVRLAWSASALLAALSLWLPAVPRGVMGLSRGRLLADGAWTGTLYAFVLAGLIVATLAELVRGYRSAEHRASRGRLRTVLAGFAIGALALIDFVAAPELFGIGALGPFAVAASMLVLGYAASRHRAFSMTPAYATGRILKVMGDGVFVCDRDGRIRTANPAAVRLLGRTQEEVTGMRLDEVLRRPDSGAGAPEERDPMEHPVRDAIYELVDSDGESIDVSVSSEQLREDGVIRGGVVVVRDVRERLRSERELQSAELRYRSLFWYNPAPAYEISLDGRFLNVNAAGQHLLGRSRDELEGKPFVDIIAPEDRALAEEVFEEVLRGRAQKYAIGIRDSGGSRREIQGVSTPVMRGEELVGVFGVALDLTEELEARRQLEIQRRQYEDLFEASPEAMLVTDLHGRILRVNREFTRLFGYEPDEAIGRVVDELLVPPESLDEAKRMTHASHQGEVVHAEAVRLKKDGSLVDVSILARELRLPDQPTRMYGIYRDITDRKQTEQRLRQREEELRHAQRIEAVGKLAGGVAHDFNNLITVILGHARFALEGLAPDSPVRPEIEEVERAGARAAELTQQMLAFSRRQVLHPEIIDVATVVQGVQRMLGRLMAENIQIELDLAETTTVLADRGQLEQVLVNLAVNARDAMPEGGQLLIRTERARLEPGDPRVESWEVEPGEFIRITVCDTGVGMDRETLAHAFEPFFTTKEPGKGTGLGLATVFGIVKQSSGHVTAESAPGAGTRICVWLPAPDATAEPNPPQSGAPRREIEGTATVLVVEDEDPLRTLACRALRRRGYTVVEAADGIDALEQASAHAGAIDLLLTDLIMPRMGGRELARRMRRGQPDLPVLFMSGYDEAGPEDAEHGELLPKPFTPADLERRVARILERAG